MTLAYRARYAPAGCTAPTTPAVRPVLPSAIKAGRSDCRWRRCYASGFHGHNGVAQMVSLKEQFLKAGLVDKKKVKLANQDKSKQKKDERKSGTQSVDEVRIAAQEIQRKNAERARELNAQRDAAANQKAIVAQIAQMVQKNRQSKGNNGDVPYNFTFNNKIERIYVTAAVQAHLVAGRLVIICLGGAVELVPRIIADKIAERDPAIVVRVKQASTEVDEDDPYAAFQIPDDLMW